MRRKLNSLLSFFGEASTSLKIEGGQVSLSGDRAILRSVYKGILPAVAWNCALSLGRVQKFQYIKCSSIVPAKERGGPLRRMSVPRGGGGQQ